ncbi:MAG: GtrA family protein [Ruminococcus sp.]|jgi:putative flippase GtrA|nr:GtrA family protein [Ruminococcus sp.]
MNKLIRKIVSIFPKPIRDLYEKHESILLYLFYGFLTTVVSFAVQYAADALGANTQAATIISWVCAVTFAFFVNKFYVFDSKGKDGKTIFREVWQFYAARIVSGVFEVVFLTVTVDVLGLNVYVFKLIAQIIIVVTNYIFSKFVVFKKGKSYERSE